MDMYENEIPAEEELPRIRAEELEQYSDAQLQEFLLRHERYDNGNFSIPVDLESWKALPSDASQLLVARLQEQKLAIQNHRVNPDELFARLSQIPLDNNDRPERTSETTTRTTTIMGSEYDRRQGENERADYYLLLADGGRPFYSIEKLDAVEQDPDSHYDLIGPWKHLDSFSGGLFEWEVFQRQLDRWEQFRRWQLEHRSSQDAHACEKHIEKVRTKYARFAGRSSMDDRYLAELDDPAGSSERKRFQARDRVRKLTLQKLSQGGHLYTAFSNYTEDVRRCLRQHGFLDRIDLDMDPKKQDELTTWAEYVHFEFWWLAAYERVLERATPKMRRQWEKLHEQGIFDKDETFDVVRSEDFRKQLWREKEASLSVVQRLKDQLWFGSGSTTERDPKTEERMHTAEKDHEPVEKRFKAVLAVQNRGQFLKYSGYLQSHKSLFQWTLDQFRQIQAGIGPLSEKTPVDNQKPKAVEGGEGNLEPLAAKSPADATTKRKAGDDEPVHRAADKPKGRRDSSQEAPNIQPTSGISAAVHGRGLTTLPQTSEESNVTTKRQRKSSPSAKNPQDSERPTGETGSIMCQVASASQDSTDAAHGPVTMV
uniref:Ankyrin 2,3/unc44 n=1 Tax=Bionectria ochroleuca TaxID=29856 RepID=A0A8H7KDJ9_BIOOC